MSDETAKVIEELIELEKKTTPGKWDNSYNRKAVTREDWKSYHPVLAHCSTFEDGDFIVALRNAFPVLADLARRAVEAEKSTATTAMGSEPLQHGMNCGALSVHSDSSACTCGLHWRKQLQTEQAMHAAWRKRAEEAEKTLLAAGNEISELSMIATNIETRAERAESRVRELEEALKDISGERGVCHDIGDCQQRARAAMSIDPKRIERLWEACPDLRPEGLHVAPITAHAIIRDKIVWWLASRQDAPAKLFPPNRWDRGLSGGSQDAFDDAVAFAHRESKFMIGPFTESGSCPSDRYTTFEPIGKFDDPTEACILAAERVLGLPEWTE